MLMYSCQDIEIFDKYIEGYKSRYPDTPAKFYLSYKNSLAPEESEKLDEHIVRCVKCIDNVRDHLHPIAKLIKRLEYTVAENSISIEKAYEIAQDIVRFVVFYHDIGKAEISYQLYAHKIRSTVPPPHNYSSIAFIIHGSNESLRLDFIENLVAKDLSLKTTDTLYLASLVAIAMHHEYYDYEDLSFIYMLTPSTLYLAKGVKPETSLCFHATVYDVIESALNELQLNLRIPKPMDNSKTGISMSFGRVAEFIASLHYEFGALRMEAPIATELGKGIELAISLAEALTWVLALVDNLAARRREEQHREEGEKGRHFFAEKILNWYG